MLSIKSDANMSEADFNTMITAIKEVFPPDNTMPTDYYHHRKTMNELGLPVVKIDACKNGCMLYWKHDATTVSCKFCDEPRYKQIKGGRRLLNNHTHKRIAQAILRYLPLTPRLQRLYASNAATTHMTWHATHERNEGVMQHPSDVEAWKHFNRTFLDFAEETRNIRLGFCADSFAPHGQFGRTYLCWPVVVTPYNLPPEEKGAVFLCNLEKIFPPAFFDSMEHLVVHLPYEARIGGPVQYRWMYPFERFHQELKKTLKNKAHVEGSICQAYIAQEINIFTEHYFEPHIEYRRRRLRRNDEGVANDIFPPFSIFNYIGRAQDRPKISWLLENELHVAHTYILRNCPKVQPYYKIFVNYLQGNPTDAIDKAIDKHFAKWFESFVANEINQVTVPLLQSLAWGPSKKATTWPGYFINGYNFHTITHGMEKATMNSGVCVQGTNVDDSSTDFYGLLEDIVQLEYHGSRWNHVVLFECTWFDPINGTKVHPIYKLVDINRKRIYPKYDPFVLA
ncbi:uncharacterized protein LOC120263115 [Dioscorea cayenensis subsp. rotundata]|uniref:Uncharacterized protein LOC120263115 n=1 Tax=Dioscorea cayennensis subsp. rotundata TaxID=55577 RepID=A0AB40BIM3_DIOCR|nr:uncharacterized protein LOC120263115 [Dioscorea cayenensis subsp. rotundata]